LIAHVFVQISGKYLVLKRSKIKRGKRNMFPEWWDIPGGRVEVSEFPQTAAVREVKEETNLSVKLGNIIYEESEFDVEKQLVFTRLVYASEEVKPELFEVILDPEEHSEYRLISSIDEMPEGEKLVPYVEELFRKIDVF